MAILAIGSTSVQKRNHAELLPPRAYRPWARVLSCICAIEYTKATFTRRVGLPMGEEMRIASGRGARVPPDVAVISLWMLAVAVAAFARESWWGDGMRHLPAILGGDGPVLGAARWLLFPPLLFVVVRPFVLLKWVTTVDGGARVFGVVSLLCVLVVLLSLRKWLIARGAPPWTRAAALALAAVTVPMLRMGTDILEPTFAMVPAIAALAYAADHGRNEAGGRRALLVAVAGIGLASLIYQGLVPGARVHSYRHPLAHPEAFSSRTEYPPGRGCGARPCADPGPGDADDRRGRQSG